VIWESLTDSYNELTAGSREEINKRAGWLFKNVGMVRGIYHDLIRYVVGPGIYAFADTGDADLDREYDRWYNDWCKLQDAGGRLTQYDKQRVRCGLKFLSGDCFTILTLSPTGYPQTQLVRAHNCASESGDGYIDGVKLGRANRALAYKFRLQSGGYKPVPVSQVIHSFMPLWGDEVRQVSCLAAAVCNLQDALESLVLEKGAVKDLSRTARVITPGAAPTESELPTDDPLGTYTDGTTLEGVPLEAVFGAEIVRLRQGETLSSFAPNRPSPTFTGFLEYLGREIFAATGWRYEFTWDPKSLTGPAVRHVIDSIERAVALWQEDEIGDTHRERAYAIAAAIDRGDLPFTPNWWRASYLPGAPRPSIDKGRDSAQDRENIKMGLDTYRALYGARGKRWQDELTQAADEAVFIQELAKERGIDPALIQQIAPNQTPRQPDAVDAEDTEGATGKPGNNDSDK
jgi:capsid protein